MYFIYIIMMLWDQILFTYVFYNSIFKSFVKIFIKKQCSQ
jgi:hypothetical protein